MRYTPCWQQIGISQERYLELLNFCRQYPEWKLKANSLLGTRGIRSEWTPRGNKNGDPVATAAEKRERLLIKIDLVDECAKSIGGGSWYAALVQSICYGTAWTKLDVTLLPTSTSNEFFKMRRQFFELLNQKHE